MLHQGVRLGDPQEEQEALEEPESRILSLNTALEIAAHFLNRSGADRVGGCRVENAFLLEVDQMESIWGFTAADLLMRLPSVQESECECDISSWFFET